MRAKVLIGSEEVEYDGTVNVEFAIDDIRSFNIGNLNNSYTISLPRTKANERILQNTTLLNSSEPLDEKGSIYVGGIKILEGNVKVYSVTSDYVKIYISGDDIADEIKGKSLRDLVFTSSNFALTAANVIDSWSGDDKFYRFPMITWCRLWSEETPGTGANWLPNDFVPMFRVKNIIEKIFPGWVIDGTFFASTRGRNAYILGHETIAPDTFIENKGFLVKPTNYSENNNTRNWTATSIGSITVTKNPVSFNTVTTDEASAWSTGNDEYTVPATGTYRFIFTVRLKNSLETLPQFVVQNNSYDVRVIQNSTNLVRLFDSSPIITLNNLDLTLDTGWVHMTAGDKVKCTATATSAAENTGGAVTTDIGVDNVDSKFEATFDRRNLYPGLNFTVAPTSYMPDIDQYDFIRAIKEDYNLRFIFDRYNRVIYVYSGSDLLGSNIIDITPDYSRQPEVEYIAQNYKRYIDLKYKHDSNDYAVDYYFKGNLSYPYEKEIELTNSMVQDGRELRESYFSQTVRGVSTNTGGTGDYIIQIFGPDPDLSYQSIPARRSNEFLPRLLQWFGLSSGITFTFDDTLYSNQYPKAETPDKAELYSELFYSTIRRINVGKLIKINRLIEPSELAEFITEVADESKEGFRRVYRVEIAGEKALLMLNRITTDGRRADCEFVII